MQKSKNPIQKFFVLGAISEYSFYKKRDIIFTNQAIFIFMLIFCLIGIANFITGNYLRILAPIYCFFLISMAYYFQHKRKFFLAKWWTLFCPLSGMILSTIIFGGGANEHFFTLPVLVVGLLLFHAPKQHLTLVISHTLVFVSMLYITTNFEPLISGQDSEILGYIYLSAIPVIMYISLSQSSRHYERYEKRIIQLLADINDKNQKLENQNEYIERQSQKLKLINQSLEKEVTAKEKAKKEALDSNKELEQFAYIASHDLKEPLRTIGSFTKLIDKRCGDQFDEEAKKYFHFVTEGVDRMTCLLEDLLALSRLNKRLDFTKVELNNCVEMISYNLQELIIRSEGEILCKELPVIIANKTQMSQLFQNLISNGLKFKRDVPSRIEIDYQERKDDFLFQIKDNGIGISKEHQDKIFTIFQRLHRRDEYEGTGIGLAVCKKIVQNHGGQIWVESEYGKGTTVFFTLVKKNLKLTPTSASNQDVVEGRAVAV